MADPYVILAPLVEPPLAPVPAAVAADPVPWLLLAAALVAALVALLLVLGLLYAAWRHAAPGRALRRIAQLPDPVQGAHALAQWQRQQARVLPPAWQQALERLRFGAPGPQGAQTLQRLCAEAAATDRGRAR